MKEDGEMKKLSKIVDKFKEKNILVLGDLMLDKYVWGDVARISPEAPVPVVDVMREEHVPGGAANVASNISSLGSNVCVMGIVGKDETKEKLTKELIERKIDTGCLITDESKRTIQKVRVFGRNQQLIRFDYEKKGYISKNTEVRVISMLKEKIKNVDAIIISDYAKGTVTRNIIDELKKMCKKEDKMIIVDPKPFHKRFYENVTLITPNHAEAHKMAGIGELKNEDEDIKNLGNKLIEELKSNILITRGEKGMSLFEKSGKVSQIPTFAKEIFDIVGAGDTSVATLTLALASGANFEEAAIIANHAAGITVGKVGTSTVSLEELKESIKNG